MKMILHGTASLYPAHSAAGCGLLVHRLAWPFSTARLPSGRPDRAGIPAGRGAGRLARCRMEPRTAACIGCFANSSRARSTPAFRPWLGWRSPDRLS